MILFLLMKVIKPLLQHGGTLNGRAKRKEGNSCSYPSSLDACRRSRSIPSCFTDFLNKARSTKNPNIPFTRIGGRILYDRHALDTFLESLEEI